MHELVADVPAVGQPQDFFDLAHRRGFEAEHVIDEDGPIHIGFGEAVGRGVELRMGVTPLDPKRVEIGVEMAADSVRPDQHEGAQRIERRTAQCPRVCRSNGRSGHSRFFGFDGRNERTVCWGPARPLHGPEGGGGVIAQFGEEPAPTFV